MNLVLVTIVFRCAARRRTWRHDEGRPGENDLCAHWDVPWRSSAKVTPGAARLSVLTKSQAARGSTSTEDEIGRVIGLTTAIINGVLSAYIPLLEALPT